MGNDFFFLSDSKSPGNKSKNWQMGLHLNEEISTLYPEYVKKSDDPISKINI